MSSTSLVHRPSPMPISMTDRLVGFAVVWCLALRLASSSTSSAPISEISATSSWFLNNAPGLNCSTSGSSSNFRRLSLSNILYEKRLVFLLKIGCRQCFTSRTLSNIGKSKRLNMWQKYFIGTWKQSTWHHLAVWLYKQKCQELAVTSKN